MVYNIDAVVATSDELLHLCCLGPNPQFATQLLVSHELQKSALENIEQVTYMTYTYHSLGERARTPYFWTPLLE